MDIKNNSGSLFRNDRKEREGQPDYTGNVCVNGKTMRIAAWVRKSNSGKQYMSLSFSDPNPNSYQASAPAPSAPVSAPTPQESHDDLPF